MRVVKVIIGLIVLAVFLLASYSYFLWVYTEIGYDYTSAGNLFQWSFAVASWLVIMWVIIIIFEL